MLELNLVVTFRLDTILKLSLETFACSYTDIIGCAYSLSGEYVDSFYRLFLSLNFTLRTVYVCKIPVCMKCILAVIVPLDSETKCKDY